MWVAGIGQGLMLRAFDQYGNLAYTFTESVVFLHQPYVVRAIGGGLFLLGMLIMAFNVLVTIRQGVRGVAAARDAATDAQPRTA
jgi:cytochrome c oxidase cbb3-type subunit 1